MSETKHSKAPWEISHIEGDKEIFIAQVGGTTAIASIFCDPLDDEAKANAKLIAAAPELLARLTKLVVLDDDQLFGAINSEMKAYLVDCWKYLKVNGFIENEKG